MEEPLSFDVALSVWLTSIADLSARTLALYHGSVDHFARWCTGINVLTPGDLVAYVDARHQIITHRVVRLEETTLITKGDNRDHDAPPVPFERMLGKVETWRLHRLLSTSGGEL